MEWKKGRRFLFQPMEPRSWGSRGEAAGIWTQLGSICPNSKQQNCIKRFRGSLRNSWALCPRLQHRRMVKSPEWLWKSKPQQNMLSAVMLFQYHYVWCFQITVVLDLCVLTFCSEIKESRALFSDYHRHKANKGELMRFKSNYIHPSACKCVSGALHSAPGAYHTNLLSTLPNSDLCAFFNHRKSWWVYFITMLVWMQNYFHVQRYDDFTFNEAKNTSFWENHCITYILNQIKTYFISIKRVFKGMKDGGIQP